jgi:hypothetical protein
MSAVANILHESKEILVSARLFLYGQEANVELGEKIVDEINGMWNSKQVRLPVNEQPYLIRFDISFVVVPLDDIFILALNNGDYRNNFVRIEKSNHITRSMMGFVIGDNSGHWITTDDLGISTTASHEFGHALGLPHPKNLDYRGTGVPPLMAPRGTFVDAEYQWDTKVKAGEYGGTMNAKHRKVSVEEIIVILAPFDLSSGNTFNIGSISNNLYDAIANRLVLA